MTVERLKLSMEEALRRLIPSEDDIPSEALRTIVPLLEEQEFPDGYRIAIQSAPGDAMYFIAAGTVSVTRSPFGIGEPYHVTNLYRGDVVGEMALVNNQLRSATVTAVGDVTAYILSRDNWIHIQAFFPGLASKIRDIARGREEYNLGRRT